MNMKLKKAPGNAAELNRSLRLLGALALSYAHHRQGLGANIAWN